VTSELSVVTVRSLQYAADCVKFAGEVLSRCSNKIESVDLRKCPYYRCRTNTPFTRYNRLSVVKPV